MSILLAFYHRHAMAPGVLRKLIMHNKPWRIPGWSPDSRQHYQAECSQGIARPIPRCIKHNYYAMNLQIKTTSIGAHLYYVTPLAAYRQQQK
jgi:hypothetical protein